MNLERILNDLISIVWRSQMSKKSNKAKNKDPEIYGGAQVWYYLQVPRVLESIDIEASVIDYNSNKILKMSNHMDKDDIIESIKKATEFIQGYKDSGYSDDLVMYEEYTDGLGNKCPSFISVPQDLVRLKITYSNNLRIFTEDYRMRQIVKGLYLGDNYIDPDDRFKLNKNFIDVFLPEGD